MLGYSTKQFLIINQGLQKDVLSNLPAAFGAECELSRGESGEERPASRLFFPQPSISAADSVVSGASSCR